MTTGRRQEPLPARKTLLLTGIGLLLALVAAGLSVLVWIKVADIDAYETAPACPADTASGDCTTTAPAVVKDTENQPMGKGQRHWLLLTTGDSDTVQRIRMDGTRPVYDVVRGGDKVTLTYWQGEISTVRLGAETQETWASPAHDWRWPLAFALLALPFGLMLMLLGWWYRYRYPRATTAVPWLLTTTWMALCVVSCTGFVAGMTADTVRQVLLITAGSVPPSLLLGLVFAWSLRRRLAKAADTSDIVPTLAKERQCLPATVSGDVFYGRDEARSLVVGDGPLTVTPDLRGYVARTPIPGTLTVQRVRAFRLGDPDSWQQRYKLDGVVLECEDGGRPVMIATSRRDASTILGALTLPSGTPTQP